MEKIRVCKYCGSDNISVEGKTTKYYYCKDCDRPTDLISKKEWNELSNTGKDINITGGCLGWLFILMLPWIIGAVALLILAVK